MRQIQQFPQTEAQAVSGATPSWGTASPFVIFCWAAALGACLKIFSFDMLFEMTIRNMPFVAVGTGFYIVGATVAAVYLRRNFPHRSLGWCNVVTLARLALVGLVVVAMLAGIGPNWTVFALAVLALSLDGVDGWLARKQDLASDFGAHFDVEVDAAFALVLAIYAAASGTVGPYVILVGLPYYLFQIARLRFTWLNRPLPPSLSRKAVCVFQIGALVALLVPVLDKGALSPVLVAVVLALLGSFGRDILWLWHQRKAPL